jgi:hypothetical protein
MNRQQTDGTAEHLPSTRSVGMTLARRFNAGIKVLPVLVA